MNTKNIILLFILFCAFSIKAQNAIQNKLSPTEYKPSLIELKKFSSGSHKFIFIAERDDTTRMGFFWGSNRQYYFMFPKPAAIYLAEKINNKKVTISADTLYIGIKRIWISQVNLPPSATRAFLLNSYSTIGYCRIICNFYKKDNDKFYLVNTYDSIVSKKGYLGNTKDKLLEENFSILRDKADSITANPVTFKDPYYPHLKSLKPILAVEKINNGVYLTLQDFVNNKPIDLNLTYSVSHNHEELLLTEKKSNDSIYTEQCWGFCKDNIPYMRIGSRFSRLTKIQNTFELRIPEYLQDRYSKDYDAFWLGFDIVRDLRSGLPIFALSDIISHKSPSETILRVSPFKLDMETGNIY